MCGRKAGTNAGENVGDGLLLSMIVNPGPRSRRTVIPSAGAMAARRSDPGVCGVPRSNPAGLTMWIAAKFMASRIELDLQQES
jgi:hypothetical protein